MRRDDTPPLGMNLNLFDPPKLTNCDHPWLDLCFTEIGAACIKCATTWVEPNLICKVIGLSASSRMDELQTQCSKLQRDVVILQRLLKRTLKLDRCVYCGDFFESVPASVRGVSLCGTPVCISCVKMYFVAVKEREEAINELAKWVAKTGLYKTEYEFYLSWCRLLPELKDLTDHFINKTYAGLEI